MPFQNVFTDRFSLSVPVIQAPMAGGGDTSVLVAAVSNAGGLGLFGAAYLTPEQIEERGHEIRSLTKKAFGVNLFAPTTVPENTDWQNAAEKLLPYYKEVSATPPAEVKAVPYDFNAQLEAALNTGAKVFSFTFGDLRDEIIAKIKSRGLYVVGTATTVEEAMALQESGVDAIVAQGAEAGGHRGTFLEDFESSLVGTIALVPQIVDAVAVPVIASGGIMDGRGVAAAIVLGACAAQLGTAFLTCKEAGVPDAYKEAIFSAREQDTRITRAFSGRPARGIVNRFMREVGDDVPPFPIQNQLTRPLRNAAAKVGLADLLNLWAGQGTRMARRQSAADLIALIDVELGAAFRKVAG